MPDHVILRDDVITHDLIITPNEYAVKVEVI